MYPKVKAVGNGHSWWREQFCAGNDSQSLDLVMTELKGTLDFILKPVDPSAFKNNKTIPADFPIKVDEDAQLVTVAAGVPQRMLLDYLANYRYWKNPSGWVLPAHSWFIDQTIGGAVSTDTHGSSFRWGSLSGQLRGLKVVLANGTLLSISPKDNVHLWRALAVSVGRLGVIVEVTLRIRPQMAVTRSLQELDFEDFAARVKSVQDEYKAAKANNDEDGQRKALAQLDETNAFWHYALREVWRVDFDYTEKEPLKVFLNLDQSDPRVGAMSGPSPAGVYSQVNRKATPPNSRLEVNPRFWANFYRTTMRGFVTPGKFESSKAFLAFSDFGTKTTSAFAPYNQLEVSVPMEIAGDCLMEVGNEMYGPAALWEGFRTPGLIRFVTAQDFYLSNTNGGPRMYVNIEDYLSLSNGQPNTKWNGVVDNFRQRCNARLHWGKYGLGEGQWCFDGSKEYPKSWCDFGCAVSQLDPSGKFSSQSKVWSWQAVGANGANITNFASCCTSGPHGTFDYSRCTCRSVPTC